jgi:hypothetical protein
VPRAADTSFGPVSALLVEQLDAVIDERGVVIWTAQGAGAPHVELPPGFDLDLGEVEAMLEDLRRRLLEHILT